MVSEFRRTGADEVIRSKIADICVSMSAEDYLEIPECIYVAVHDKLDDKAQRLYNEFERTIDVGSAAVLSNKLLQWTGLCEDKDANNFDKEYFADIIVEIESYIENRIQNINSRADNGMRDRKRINVVI